MRIAYISYPAFADCDFPLVRSLREAGHDVLYYLVVSPYHCHSTLIDIGNVMPVYRIMPGTEYHELDRYNTYLRTSSIRIVNLGGKDKLRIFRLWEKLRKELKSFSPDVIQLTHFLPPYGIPIYFSFWGQISITVHDPIPHMGEDSSWQEKLRRIGLRYVSSICFLSRNEWLKTQFLKKYKVSENKIHYAGLAPYDVLNFIERDKSNYASDFLFVGRISPYKGVDTLLSAMRILRERNIKCKLIIAGAGSLPIEQDLYKDSDDITIINRYISVTELVAMIQDAKYVVCPYKEATQSGVIMSAFALGRAVIASRVGDFESVVEEGKNGFLVEANNPEALADAMERRLCLPIVRVGKETGAWKHIAEQYVEMYQKTLNKS